nr:transmembrane epididymal protein 1-like [Gorilla gorilla gorilla]
MDLLGFRRLKSKQQSTLQEIPETGKGTRLWVWLAVDAITHSEQDLRGNSKSCWDPVGQKALRPMQGALVLEVAQGECGRSESCPSKKAPAGLSRNQAVAAPLFQWATALGSYEGYAKLTLSHSILTHNPVRVNVPHNPNEREALSPESVWAAGNPWESVHLLLTKVALQSYCPGPVLVSTPDNITERLDSVEPKIKIQLIDLPECTALPPTFSSTGGFEGHLYPGLSFFFYGLYHAQLVSRALICNAPVQYPPRHPWSKGRWARLWQIYYIGLLKILTACILVAQELHSIPRQFVLISKMYHQRNFMFRKQWQHLTLYMTFLLSGCVDMVSQNLLPKRCAALEQGAQALGMFIFLPLMVSHLQDTEGMELQSHVLLTQAMFLLTLVVTAELWAPNMPLIWIMKAFLYMITGSWLMHIGFMLFKPISGYQWMDDDRNDIMFVTTFFCWHVIFSAILMICIYGFSFWWYCYIFVKA